MHNRRSFYQNINYKVGLKLSVLRNTMGNLSYFFLPEVEHRSCKFVFGLWSDLKLDKGAKGDKDFTLFLLDFVMLKIIANNR